MSDELTEQALDAGAVSTAPEVTEPDGHPRWRVTLYTAWVAQLCAMMGFSFVMPFIPFYVRELGVHDPKALYIWSGALVTGSGLMMSVTAPLWGWMADRYGRKAMVQRAMFGGAVILSAMSRVENVQQLFWLRTLQGGFTGTISASVALVSSVVPAAALGYSLGLMQAAVSAGASLGPLMGGVVAERWGSRPAFLVTGALLLISGLLVRFGAKERFHRPAPASSGKEGNGGGLRDSAREFMASPAFGTFASVLVICTMMNLSLSLPGEIFPLFVEKILGGAPGAKAFTGMLIAGGGLAAALSAVCSGLLSQRYGYKRVLIICVSLVGALAFFHLWVQTLWQLAVLRVLIGLAAGGLVPSMNAIIATLVSRRNLGKAYGVTATASALGWAFGPLLGGVAASRFGLRLPFAIMGGLMLIMALAARRAIRLPQGTNQGAAAR